MSLRSAWLKSIARAALTFLLLALTPKLKKRPLMVPVTETSVAEIVGVEAAAVASVVAEIEIVADAAAEIAVATTVGDAGVTATEIETEAAMIAAVETKRLPAEKIDQRRETAVHETKTKKHRRYRIASRVATERTMTT